MIDSADVLASPSHERAAIALAFGWSESCLPELAARLTLQHFSDHDLRPIWLALCALLEDRAKIEPWAVAGRMKPAELFAAGGVDYLLAMEDALPSPEALDEIVRVLDDRLARRQAVKLAGEIRQQALDFSLEGQEIIPRARAACETALAAGGRTAGRGVGAVLSEVQAELAGAKEAGVDLTTGFPTLDALTAGLERTLLTILAGRPSMGKTALALQIAYRNATRGKVVCFRSCESSDKSLGKRLISQVAGIDFSKIRQPWRLTPEEHRNISLTAAGLADLPLIFESDPQRTDYRDICSWVRREAAVRGRVDLLVGDYLQLVDGPEKEIRLKMDAACKAFKKLAMDLDCHVIWLSQLSRPMADRREKRPNLQDLKESGGIEAAADLVLFPFRPHYFDAAEPAEAAEVNVAKQRDGPAGPDVVAHLGWEGGCIRFR